MDRPIDQKTHQVPATLDLKLGHGADTKIYPRFYLLSDINSVSTCVKGYFLCPYSETWLPDLPYLFLFTDAGEPAEHTEQQKFRKSKWSKNRRSS